MLMLNKIRLNPRLVGQVFRQKLENENKELKSLNPRLVGQVFRPACLRQYGMALSVLIPD